MGLAFAILLFLRPPFFQVLLLLRAAMRGHHDNLHLHCELPPFRGEHDHEFAGMADAGAFYYFKEARLYPSLLIHSL